MIPTELPSRRYRRRTTRDLQLQHVKRLIDRRDELRTVERQGIEHRPLDEPVFMGYVRYFAVRDDLQHSDDGPYLQRLVSLLQNEEPCNREGVRKERDWRRGGKLRVVEHRPKVIDAGTYWAMTSRMRREFTLHVFKRRNPFTRRVELETVFVLTRPWKFVTKIRESWKTHETVYTVNVDAEKAEILRHLYGPSAWTYRHWARHVGDNYNKWDDWRVPPSDLRRMPANYS